MLEAQLRELRRQVPMLYALLSVSTVAVAYTHLGLAPAWMSLGTPAAMIALMLLRIRSWWSLKPGEMSADQARGLLRRTVVLAALLAVGEIGWALKLSQYGGAYEQAHVAIFVSVTVIGCIFCLMKLPQAAVAVLTVVTFPYLLFYFNLGNSVFLAIAFNILLVKLVMLQVLKMSFANFTELVQSQAETERLGRENLRLAHTDALTSLPNRRYFFLEFEARLEEARRTGRTLAVGIIDLDRFKAVNDTFGHVSGDRLLEQAGERLAEILPPGIVLSRLGGDEFGFFGEMSTVDAKDYGLRLCDALSIPFQIEDLTLTIGGSCGIAFFPEGGSSSHTLFDHADYALYTSKSAGRGTTTLYSAEHETKIQSDRAMEAALRTADFNAEMEIHLQPIVSGANGRATGVEALARWTSPSLGSVRPDLFIVSAERTGLIHELTLALLRKALKALEGLPADLYLSFNLSAQNVTSTRTALAIAALVRSAPIDPARLTFELTETAVMRDFEVARTSMQMFRGLGARIALDDFGTGYSSLGYLHRLPIDRVKVDRSFVRDCTNPTSRSILVSILALCATVDLDCLVEGVETKEQHDILLDLGCQSFQGYHFGRPMPLEALLGWHAERRAVPAAEPPLARLQA